MIVMIAALVTLYAFQWKVFISNGSFAEWLNSIAAFASIAVSVWAVRLVDETLRETRRTADAAVAANSTAREIGEAQARAYLSIKEINFFIETDGRYCFEVEIVNSGVSPARDLSGSEVAAIFTIGSTDQIQPTPNPFITRDVPGSDKIYLAIYVPSGLHGNQGVIATISVNFEYSTVFGSKRYLCHARGAAHFKQFPPNVGQRTSVTIINTLPK